MSSRIYFHLPNNQLGAAFLLLIVTLVLASAAAFYGLFRMPVQDIEKNRITADVLQQAKAALIGYAVSVTLKATPASKIRPGDLPCPDINDNGLDDDGSCGNAAGTTGQALRLGRLPWKTLGLPDLRDGDGERLWYAVSNNFKNNTRTDCSAKAPQAPTCLNSDTRGTITIRDSAGNIIYDATAPADSGVIAVLFSPGAALRRQDGVLQNRTCMVGAQPAECTAAGVCNSMAAPKCNPMNYLDIRVSASGTEDNANFIDDDTNGFINGVVRDIGGNPVVNDRLIVITYQDLLPQLEKRVAGEISNCLVAYANVNFGRYPWAAPATNVTTPFSDGINTLLGRIPDRPLSQTQLGHVPVTSPSALVTALQAACALPTNLCMSTRWPQLNCSLPTDPTADSWWNNWKLHVFYGVADTFKPQIVFTQPTSVTVLLGNIAPPTGCLACLTVTPPSSASDKQFVVIAAGRRLPGVAGGQPRTTTSDLQIPANYLEGGNDTHPTFSQQSQSTTFNDVVRYK